MPKARRSSVGAVAALAVHLLLGLLILRLAPIQRYEFAEAAGDPGSTAPGGGGGGGRMVLMSLPPAPAPPPPPPPPPPVVPVPTPAVVPPPVEQLVVDTVIPRPESPPDTVVVARADSAAGGTGGGTGAGSGKGSGSGTGTGSGSGSGNGSGSGSGDGPGSGAGGRARAPEPRQLILPPPDIPGGLRGVTIKVTFKVGPDGRVVEVSFAPEPDDRGFARKLEEVMRSYRFRPARGSDGLPVAGTTMVSLTF